MSERPTQKVTLDHGFKRGDETITEVLLRKPLGGDLRGLSTIDVIRQEYAAIEKLLPRISTPMIHEADVKLLEPEDLNALGAECGAFFLSRQQRAEFGLNA